MSSTEKESAVPMEMPIGDDSQKSIPVNFPESNPQSTCSNVSVTETEQVSHKKKKIISLKDYIKNKKYLRLNNSSSKVLDLRTKEVKERKKRSPKKEESRKTKSNLSSPNEPRRSNRLMPNEDLGVHKQDSEGRSTGWTLYPIDGIDKPIEKRDKRYILHNGIIVNEGLLRKGSLLYQINHVDKPNEKTDERNAKKSNVVDVADKELNKRNASEPHDSVVGMANKELDKRNASEPHESVVDIANKALDERNASEPHGGAVDMVDKESDESDNERNASEPHGGAVDMADKESDESDYKSCASVPHDNAVDVADQESDESNASGPHDNAVDVADQESDERNVGKSMPDDACNDVTEKKSDKRNVSESMPDDACNDVTNKELGESSKSTRQRNEGKTKKGPGDVEEEKLSPPWKRSKRLSRDEQDVPGPSHEGQSSNEKTPLKVIITKNSSSYTCTTLFESSEDHVNGEEEEMVENETSTMDKKNKRPDTGKRIGKVKTEKSDKRLRRLLKKQNKREAKEKIDLNKKKEAEQKIDSDLKKEGFVIRQCLFCSTCNLVLISEDLAQKHIKSDYHVVMAKKKMG